MKIRWLVLVATSWILSTTGIAEPQDEKRVVGVFDQLIVNGGLELEVVIGSAKSSVLIHAEPNVLKRIKTNVKKGRLVIETMTEDPSDPFPATSVKASARIDAKSLTNIELIGNSDAKIQGISAQSFRFQSIGSSKVKLQGKVNTLEYSITGIQVVDGTALKAQSVDVLLDGMARLDVHAQKTLTGSVGDSAQLFYRGSPRVSVKTSKKGKIKKL